MTFLMGLEDSFSQIRSQVLLMDPMPPINRVFSLIVQEEQQRKTTDVVKSSDNLAFAVKSNTGKFNAMNFQGTRSVGRGNNNFNGRRSDRPFCTHCKISGHTFDRCYKVHGYPPGYRFKYNNQSQNNSSVANMANVANVANVVVAPTSFENFVKNLNADQYQQFLNICSPNVSDKDQKQFDDNTGNLNQEADWQG